MFPYFLLILGLFILLLGGKFLVDGASSIALKLGMSSGVIGLTVVAFGTSAPELLVSLNAALKGNSDISIGNVVGSNIANIGLVLGISGIFYPILINRTHLKMDYVLMIITSFIFYFFSLDQIISFWEGIFLVGGFLGLNTYLLLSLGKGSPTANELIKEELEEVKKYQLPVALLLFMIGITGLYFGSDLLVENAVIISKEFGISERVIGVTIIAIGTSLPELITSIIAALSKRTDLALGNILGSNIMNVLSIIGITALVKPIGITEAFLNSDYLWMLGISLILFPIMRTKMKVSKIEGSILLLIYICYLYFLL
jgi:cation:H+ antiporter